MSEVDPVVIKRAIDPIVMREKQKRLRQAKCDIAAVETAVDALLWFDEFAKPGHQIINKPTVVASATPNVSTALAYIVRAASEMETAIIDRAVKLAKTDLARAKDTPND